MPPLARAARRPRGRASRRPGGPRGEGGGPEQAGAGDRRPSRPARGGDRSPPAGHRRRRGRRRRRPRVDSAGSTSWPGATTAWASCSTGHSRFEEAAVQFQHAVAIRDDLVRRHPSDGRLQARLAESLINLGQVHRNPSQIDQAEREFARAAALLSSLVRGHPGRVDFALLLGKLYLNSGALPLGRVGRSRRSAATRRGSRWSSRSRRNIAGWLDVKQACRDLNGALAQALGVSGRQRRQPGDGRGGPSCRRRGGGPAVPPRRRHRAGPRRPGRRGLRRGPGDRLGASGRPSPEDDYNLACVAALAAAAASRSGAPGPRRPRAGQALRWLRRVRRRRIFPRNAASADDPREETRTSNPSAAAATSGSSSSTPRSPPTHSAGDRRAVGDRDILDGEARPGCHGDGPTKAGRRSPSRVTGGPIPERPPPDRSRRAGDPDPGEALEGSAGAPEGPGTQGDLEGLVEGRDAVERQGRRGPPRGCPRGRPRCPWAG